MNFYTWAVIIIFLLMTYEYLRLYFAYKQEKQLNDEQSKQNKKMIKIVEEINQSNDKLMTEWADTIKLNAALTRELNYYKYPQRGQENKTYV